MLAAFRVHAAGHAGEKTHRHDTEAHAETHSPPPQRSRPVPQPAACGKSRLVVGRTGGAIGCPVQRPLHIRGRCRGTEPCGFLPLLGNHTCRVPPKPPAQACPRASSTGVSWGPAGNAVSGPTPGSRVPCSLRSCSEAARPGRRDPLPPQTSFGEPPSVTPNASFSLFSTAKLGGYIFKRKWTYF